MRSRLIATAAALVTLPVLEACATLARSEADASTRTVRAIVAILSSAAETAPTVVDSLSLLQQAGLTSSDLRVLKTLLPANHQLGATTVSAQCDAARQLKCVGAHVRNLKRRGDELEIAVSWSPIGGCGFSSASFRVRVRESGVEILSVDDEESGSCVRR